ncbi:MAG: hypothetical protein QOF11_1727 [Chloroflexota bacterium]|jgi:PST family polysaccharide transporter|nr:hypothetical protein [Chloroflexota bacterium]
MIGALRAAVLLGGSSIVAIVMLLATAKGLAVLVGPHGVGAFALLQSFVDLAGLLAGLGISVSLVRLVADALDRRDPQRVTAVRAASGVMVWSLGAVAALALVARRDALSETIFSSSELGGAVAIAALAVPFTLAAATNIATLSAYREVGAIATLRTIAVVAAAVVTLGAVLIVGEAGVAIGILASSVGLWLGASVLLRRRTAGHGWPGWSAIKAASADLVRFGLPFAGSSIVGTGIQLAIPILVAIQLNTEAAGFYRAATQISAGFVTLIAAAMLQDYYPRLSSEQARPDVLVRLIDQQLKLVMILTLPLILIGLALSDVIVPVLYSSAFEPAVAILGWQLVGTLLRLPSWTLSFAILARGRSRVYFAVELVGGLALLFGSLLGMDRLGLAGLGVAVLATYLIYYPTVWLAVKRDLPLRVSRAQRALVVTTGLALVVQALPAIGLGTLRQPLAVVLAAVWVGVAGVAASRIVRGRHQPVDGAPGGAGRATDRTAEAPVDGPEPSRAP